MRWEFEAPPERHAPFEDFQGILIGTALAALGLHLLSHPGLITGQIAGLALLIGQISGWTFGLVFILLNLPFYVLAWHRMGPTFTIKSFSAVLLLSGFTELMPALISMDNVHPAAAAILFGITSGVGLLSLFRHGASLGGVGIVALYLQDAFGFKAGWTQLIFDLCIFTAALFLLPVMTVLWSLLGAVVLNVIIAINHRRDRYIATS